jgi:hypothetical protein
LLTSAIDVPCRYWPLKDDLEPGRRLSAAV